MNGSGNAVLGNRIGCIIIISTRKIERPAEGGMARDNSIKNIVLTARQLQFFFCWIFSSFIAWLRIQTKNKRIEGIASIASMHFGPQYST